MKRYVKIGKLNIKNPLMMASGTFGLGDENSEIYSYAGAFISKTITLNPRKGNPPPRVFETPSGMINSVGLENPGADEFLIKISKIDINTKFLVSVYAQTAVELKKLIIKLESDKRIDGYELNVSCPNIKHNKVLPFVEKRYIKNMLKIIKNNTDKYVSIKLPPYTCIELARACEIYGADSICVGNTYPSLVFYNNKIIKGGFSGPAIKPMVMYNVYNVMLNTKLPVIACGGITDIEDVKDFLKLGAAAVQLGSINMIFPDRIKKILERL